MMVVIANAPANLTSRIALLKDITTKDDSENSMFDFRQHFYKEDVEKLLKNYFSGPINITSLMTRYAQKSDNEKDPKDIINCVNRMTTRLLERCLVKKVYTSVQANSTDALKERDEKKSKVEIGALKNVKENFQDLINRLKRDRRLTRLVVLDYNGVSSDFEDMRDFLKYCDQIVEIVVDFGSGIDVISREKFLKRDEVTMDKFSPRSGFNKRGMVPESM